MTVEEVIKFLKKCPKTSKVYLADMLPVLAIHNINDEIIITDQKEE